MIEFEKKEIVYHLVNSVLAGSLVFLGGLTSGNITLSGVITSIIAAGVVAITKFKQYWESPDATKKNKKGSMLFNFVG